MKITKVRSAKNGSKTAAISQSKSNLTSPVASEREPSFDDSQALHTATVLATKARFDVRVMDKEGRELDRLCFDEAGCLQQPSKNDITEKLRAVYGIALRLMAEELIGPTENKLDLVALSNAEDKLYGAIARVDHILSSTDFSFCYWDEVGFPNSEMFSRFVFGYSLNSRQAIKELRDARDTVESVKTAAIRRQSRT